MAQQLDQLIERITRLEDIDAIKNLKARYFMACDTKQPDLMKACFVDGAVTIDYGPVGSFNHRDELVALFTDVACHPHLLEMHHGHNPVIDVVDDHHANGSWELFYQAINTKDKTLTQLAIIYIDKYIKTDNEWKMVSTITQNISTMVFDIAAETPRLVHTG